MEIKRTIDLNPNWMMLYIIYTVMAAETLITWFEENIPFLSNTLISSYLRKQSLQLLIFLYWFLQRHHMKLFPTETKECLRWLELSRMNCMHLFIHFEKLLNMHKTHKTNLIKQFLVLLLRNYLENICMLINTNNKYSLPK